MEITTDFNSGAVSTLAFLLVAIYGRNQAIRQQHEEKQKQQRTQTEKEQNAHHYDMTQNLLRRRMSFHDTSGSAKDQQDQQSQEGPAWHNGNTGMNVNHHFDFHGKCSTYQVPRRDFEVNAEDELHSPKQRTSCTLDDGSINTAHSPNNNDLRVSTISTISASSAMDFDFKQTNVHHFETGIHNDGTFKSLQLPPLGMESNDDSVLWEGNGTSTCSRDRASTADGRLEGGTFSFLLHQVKKMTSFRDRSPLETEEEVNANDGGGSDNHVTTRHPTLHRSKSDRIDETSHTPSRTHNRRRSLPETPTYQHQHQNRPEGKRAHAIAAYNSRIMPRRVVMIRHGESEGNVNETMYQTNPDNSLGLTKVGWEQARMAGKVLRHEILARGQQRRTSGGGSASAQTQQTVHFIVSPYVRTMETFHGLAAAWCDPEVEFGHVEDEATKLEGWYAELARRGLTWHEDPRIREQDFGNYQDVATIEKAKQERHKFGAFYYRFPDGESGSDVFDRVSTFLDSLWRSFDLNRSQNYVLVTHGISIRVLLARYFRYSIDQFHMMVSLFFLAKLVMLCTIHHPCNTVPFQANPYNCEMCVLGHNGKGKLELEGRCELEIDEKDEDKSEKKSVVLGYKFFKKLRILPTKYLRPRQIRMSYGEDNI